MHVDEACHFYLQVRCLRKSNASMIAVKECANENVYLEVWMKLAMVGGRLVYDAGSPSRDSDP